MNSDGFFLVQALDHNYKNFQTLGTKSSLKEAKSLAFLNDNYFIRVIDANNRGEVIFQNYNKKDIQQSFM